MNDNFSLLKLFHIFNDSKDLVTYYSRIKTKQNKNAKCIVLAFKYLFKFFM